MDSGCCSLACSVAEITTGRENTPGGKGGRELLSPTPTLVQPVYGPVPGGVTSVQPRPGSTMPTLGRASAAWAARPLRAPAPGSHGAFPRRREPGGGSGARAWAQTSPRGRSPYRSASRVGAQARRGRGWRWNVSGAVGRAPRLGADGSGCGSSPRVVGLEVLGSTPRLV